jgi:hypothetical protein
MSNRCLLFLVNKFVKVFLTLQLGTVEAWYRAVMKAWSPVSAVCHENSTDYNRTRSIRCVYFERAASQLRRETLLTPSVTRGSL